MYLYAINPHSKKPGRKGRPVTWMKGTIKEMERKAGGRNETEKTEGYEYVYM